MPFGFPSGFNTFVPTFDATGHLIVGYSRNPKDFPLNKYITIVPVKRSVGYFLQLNAENAARVLGGTAQDFVWHDGNDAPSGEWNTEAHQFLNYLTIRYAFPFRLGWKAQQQADWKIAAVHAANVAQQAMTARTLNVLSLLTNSANWPTSNFSSTGTAIGGGNWNAGTATNPIIKKSINAMAIQINKITLGVVRPRSLVLVISPVAADLMARSQEIHTYLQQSPWALAQVRGDSPSQNGLYGLPDSVYGVPVVIEDTVRTTSRKNLPTGSAPTLSYVMPSTQGSNVAAMLLARPNELVSEGTSSFSTAGIFMFEELTVETKDDPDNRRTMGRVVDDYAAAMLSNISGYLINDISS